MAPSSAPAPRIDSIVERLAAVETKIDFLLGYHEKTDTYLADLRLVVAAMTTSVQGQADEMKTLRISVQALLAVESDIEAVSAEVALLKPIVADYVQKRDQAMGAAKAVRLMYGALVVLAGFLGFVASKAIERGWWN